jgi:hypothetical protein
LLSAPRDLATFGCEKGHPELVFAHGSQPNPQRRLRTGKTEPTDLRRKLSIETVIGRDLLENELPAIDALERDVIDPSSDQSTAAVLDKISGAGVIGARQRQARIQLLVGMVEQLVVDSKRARDTDTAALAMQIVTWRDGRAAAEAFVAGSGDALRTWRQP